MKELQEIREDILLLRNLGCITKELELVLLRKLNSVEQQLSMGVGSSKFKVAISDSHCTYDFEIELPKTTCIRDISKRLYASFGLKEDQGKLRK